MFSAPRVIAPLRVLLVLAALFSLVMLFLSFPGSFLHDLDRSPESANLLWPSFIGLELGVLAFLLVVVCTWQLLTKVKNDEIFSEGSMLWVNIIVWTFVGMWFAFCGYAAYVTAVIFFTPELRDPGTPLMLFGLVVIGGVLVMVVAVLRALLRRATAMQQDLEEVI
jgi:hypothetical protein